MTEIKKINPLPFLSTLEANPEKDEWIKQREKELAEQAERSCLSDAEKRGIKWCSSPLLACRF